MGRLRQQSFNCMISRERLGQDLTEPFVSKANSSDPDTKVTTFYWSVASATRHTLTVAKYLLNATLCRC